MPQASVVYSPVGSKLFEKPKPVVSTRYVPPRAPDDPLPDALEQPATISASAAAADACRAARERSTRVIRVLMARSVPCPRVECVPQTVGDNVEGEDRCEQEHPWKHHEPPRDGEQLAGLIEHSAPRGCRIWHAEPEERQIGLEQDAFRVSAAPCR